MTQMVGVMSADIRRAGYYAKVGTGSNPFMGDTTDLTINSAGNCMLLTYDKNKDGQLEKNEWFGFRLQRGVIQYRTEQSNDADCDGDKSEWEDFVGMQDIKVTQLKFTLDQQPVDLDGDGSGTANILVRAVKISLSAELVNDSSKTKTIETTVKIYNDKYVP